MLALCLAASLFAFAAPQFPPLTGRVVDQAKLLPPATVEELTRLLEQHEKATSNQVVVVTVASLQGYTIEDYGYQLGRQWGIGQKERNNGVLLIVAPNERAVRIEVGYGLEGAITDAVSRDIIDTRILPRFREGDYAQGIVDGTKAILSALAGTYTPMEKKGDPGLLVIIMILVLFVFAAMFISHVTPQSMGRRGPRGWSQGYGAGGFPSDFGRSGDDSGFSGGGGSFGGGGASGRW
jgi:uncharacterized protein